MYNRFSIVFFLVTLLLRLNMKIVDMFRMIKMRMIHITENIKEYYECLNILEKDTSQT